MKSNIIFLATLLFFANSIWAFDFQSGNFYYNITNDSASVYTVEVTYRTFNVNYFSGNVTIPSTVYHNGRTYTVESIGNDAFRNCSVRSVTIPNTVTRINKRAFLNCSSLTTIIIANSVTNIGDSAFYDCIILDSITMPNSITRIGDYAFYNCDGLNSVIIPNSVTSIGNGAFYYCSGLTSITIPSSVISIGYFAFTGCNNLRRTNYNGTIDQWCEIVFHEYQSNPLYYSHNLYINNQLVKNVVVTNTVNSLAYTFCGDTAINTVTLPNSITTIGPGTFKNCNGLSSITIPNSIITIWRETFSGCSNMTAITIPTSVQRIAIEAFYGCRNLRRTDYPGTLEQWCRIKIQSNPVSCSRNLYINNQLITNVVIPNTIDTLTATFAGDTAITSVTIPNSVRYISGTFSNCTGLTSIHIPNSVKVINGAFDGCTRLTSIDLPDSLLNISMQAFKDCRSLTTITIPNSVTSIEDYAFQGCTSLTSINIPNQITNIGQLAFYKCHNLSAITIPYSVSRIGAYAFAYDSALTNIRFLRPNTSIDNYAFAYGVPNDSIFIPCGTSRWYDVEINSGGFWPRLSRIVENMCYDYHALPHDTVMGDAVTLTSPACSNNSTWTVCANANTGFVFSHWSDGVVQNPRSLTVACDTLLMAYFVNLYNVTLNSNDTNKGSVSGSGSFAYLSQDTIIATANYGYSFSHWNDGNTQNPRIITVTQDTVITAYFVDLYNVSVRANDTSMGTVSGGGNFAYLTHDTIEASANYGYSFSHWNDGDTTNPRAFTVTQDTNFIAYFSSNYYNITVSSEDTAKGSASGSGRFTYLSQDTLIATPNNRFVFTRWSDGNTDNPRILTITQDTTLIAYFTSNQGIDEAENENVTISTANGYILLEGVSNERVYVSDVLGRVVYNATVSEKAEIAVRNRGVYFVKIGNRPAQKVVVVR